MNADDDMIAIDDTVPGCATPIYAWIHGRVGCNPAHTGKRQLHYGYPSPWADGLWHAYTGMDGDWVIKLPYI